MRRASVADIGSMGESGEGRRRPRPSSTASSRLLLNRVKGTPVAGMGESLVEGGADEMRGGLETEPFSTGLADMEEEAMTSGFSRASIQTVSTQAAGGGSSRTIPPRKPR